MKRLFRRELRTIRRVFTQRAFLFLAIIGNLILLIATVALYHFEAGVNPGIRSLFDSLWWGVSTITTVGFGDVVPVTLEGKLIGIFLMYTGTVLFISFTGVLVSVWMREEVEKEIEPIEKELKVEERETERIERLILGLHERLDRLEDKIDARKPE